MVPLPSMSPGTPEPAGGRAHWAGLAMLIRARILVLALALPIGVLLRPEATPSAWPLLWGTAIALAALSAVFAWGVRLRRFGEVQGHLQVAADVVLITVLAVHTGARESQFVLFYALAVITGGLLNRLAGGLGTAGVASAAYLALPVLARTLGVPSHGPDPGLPPPGMLIAYLGMMGVLAGVLGERVQRTKDDLDRTARELDRVRIDNDVILRHLTTGVFTVDGHGVVAYLNPAAEQVLSLRTLECRGQPIEQALPPRLAPLRELVERTLRERSTRARAELRLETTGGRELPIGISTNVLTHEGAVTGVVAVFQDLTEVREMERRARRNETLAELGALSARIAHELRNGLNPISGSVECLQRELKFEGENAVLMDLIVRECNRLNRFVTDLLTYSRERDLVPESLDLEDQLAEFCDMLGRDPRCAQVRVAFRRSGRVATARADREQIRQVWLNLAVNALEAMPRGGELEVRWSEGEAGTLMVEFVDHGPGIAAEDLPRVGQPFYTTKQGGTGLGVAIAQRIVERHGGSLVFESEPGRGTTARMTLPGAVSPIAQAA